MGSEPTHSKDFDMQLLGNHVVATGDGAVYVSGNGKALLHAG